MSDLKLVSVRVEHHKWESYSRRYQAMTPFFRVSGPDQGSPTKVYESTHGDANLQRFAREEMPNTVVLRTCVLEKGTVP